MDYLRVKGFFKGLCFFVFIGGAAAAPPVISGIPSILSFDERDDNVTLFSFTVTDEDTVTIDPYDGVTQNLVKAETHNITSQSGLKRQFNVTVMTVRRLDRDQATGGQSLYQLRFNIVDSEGNTVTTPTVYIQVNDVNDNAPQFMNLPYRWKIDEKPFNISTVYMNIGAQDYDGGYNSKLSYSMKSHSTEAAYISHFNITHDTGVVHLLKELDYEENSYYQFTVTVQDQGNPPKSATADLIIWVNDVQDTPPFFTAKVYRAAFHEIIAMGYNVLVVSAMDGDFGNPRQINYTILYGPCSSLFQIDSAGQISTKTNIGIDDFPEARMCHLTVQAGEAVSGMKSGSDETSSTTDVLITILDSDGETPANCNNNGNILIVEYMSLPTLWFATLVGNVVRLLN